jgi:hypothetical protein
VPVDVNNTMTQPCEQEDSIATILKEQTDSKITTSSILENQHHLADQHLVLVQKLDKFFDRLETILMADVERRAHVEQLIKDTDELAKIQRKMNEEIDVIQQRNAKCDGAGIFENFPLLWNHYQQEKGWRRMVPIACAVTAAIAALVPYFS